MEDHHTAHTAGADMDVDVDLDVDTASVQQLASLLPSERDSGVTGLRRNAVDGTMPPNALSAGVTRRTTTATGV